MFLHGGIDLVSRGQHSRGNVFEKLGEGSFSRYFEPLYLKHCWTYQNEHGIIKSSSSPFFELADQTSPFLNRQKKTGRLLLGLDVCCVMRA